MTMVRIMNILFFKIREYAPMFSLTGKFEDYLRSRGGTSDYEQSPRGRGTYIIQTKTLFFDSCRGGYARLGKPSADAAPGSLLVVVLP